MFKKICCILFGILAFTSVVLFSQKDLYVSALSSTDLEEELQSFTNNDQFNFNNEIYSIQDYKNSIVSNTLFGNTMKLEKNEYTVFSDDPITQIIPKNYFYNVGMETYVGNEYGFFINTTKETYYDVETKTSNNYRSYVIVFDINNDTDLENNTDRAIFTVTNLFSLEFITISQNESVLWRKDSALNSERFDDSIDYYFPNKINYESSDNYCVVPLYDLNLNAKTNRYYLNDICFAGKLQNEQAYNSNDGEYSPKNDTGSYFTRLDYIYQGKYIVDGSWADVDYGSIAEILMKDLIDSALSSVPYVGDVLSNIYSVASDGIEILNIVSNGVSDKKYNASNDSYITEAYYVNRDDQIKHYGYLTKCAYFALNTNKNLSILYEENDYAKLEYTIGHSALSKPADLTRMTSEIALKILDSNFNLVSCATGSSDFSLRDPVYEELSLGDDNKFYLLENGRNYFSFTPQYSGKYEIYLDGPDELSVNFDGLVEQGSCISLKKELNKGNKYEIVIDHMDGHRLCLPFKFNISNDLYQVHVGKFDSCIVRLDALNGFKNITFNSSNVELSLLSENFVLIKESHTNSLNFVFDGSTKYILLENNTVIDTTDYISISNNYEGINFESSKQINLQKGELFYEFVPSKSDTYSIVVIESNVSSYNFEIYSDYAHENSTTIFGNNFIIYECNMTTEKTYYIGYENCASSQGKLSIIIKSKNSIFDFYINNEIVEETAYLLQGQEFTLDVKVGNIIVDDINIYVFSGINGSYITKRNGKYIVDSNAPTSNVYCDRLAVVNQDNIQIEYISLIYLPKFTIELENYSIIDENVPNQLKWHFTSSYKENSAVVTIEFTFTNNIKKNITFTVNGQDNFGYVDLPSLSGISTTYGNEKSIASAKIIQIVLKHKWYNSKTNDSDEYNHTFKNSYPNNSKLSAKEFYFAPITINMMFNGGKGTATNPYLIINEWQLNNIRLCDSEYREGNESYHYIQSYFEIENDITLLNNWEPIDFPIKAGKIYGKDNATKIISGLNISEIKKDLSIGFVRNLFGGSIEYLNFKNVNIVIKNSQCTKLISIGVIVGSSSSGSIRNCMVEDGKVEVGNINDSTSDIGAKYTYTGGICGLGNKIYNCNNYASITSYGNLGGIAGYVDAATISNCNNYGEIALMHNNVKLSNDSDNKSAGGIVGIAHGVSFSNVSNSGMLKYISKEKIDDTSLAPRMGSIAGTVLNSTMNGENITVSNAATGFDTGNLTVCYDFLMFGKHDQKRYTCFDYGFIE